MLRLKGCPTRDVRSSHGQGRSRDSDSQICRWESQPCLFDKIGLLRTGIVRGITDSQALWGEENGMGIVKFSLFPRGPDTWRTQSAGPATARSALALTAPRAPRASWPRPSTPSSGDEERSIPGRSRPSPPSSPLSGSDLFGDGIQGQLAKEVQTDKQGALTPQTPALMERQD